MTAQAPRVSPLRRVLIDAASAWTPPPDIDPVEWGEANVTLGDWSARKGPWRSSRTPYVREPLRRFSLRDPTQRVVLMWAAQTGKTTMIMIKDGYVVVVRPRPIMIVRPKAEDAKDFSKREWAGIVRSCEALRRLVSRPKSRDSDATMLNQSFVGGRIYFRSANSPTELASIAAGDLDLDEVDRFQESSGAEGDGVDLAITRTVTFQNTRKIAMTSTPLLRDASRIEQALDEGDLRHFWVPCPRCGAAQVMTWSRIRWESGRPETAWYQCAHCGGRVEHHEKAAMMDAGEWRPMDHATEAGECSYCRERLAHDGPHVPKDPLTASYHLSALYSPWEPWSEIVRLFLAAKGDPERLKQWTNTRMAETWREMTSDAFDYDPLLRRREIYQAEVPPGVVVLTAGVDCQVDRIEVEVVGWGSGEESWSICYRVLPGDPNLPDVWAALDEVLFSGYQRADGKTLRIAATCIDTGGTGTMTNAAYGYVRRYARSLHRVWGVKGRSAKQRDKVWPRQPSVRRTKSGQAVHLYNIREDVAKDVVYARLGISEEGPGYCHFPHTYDRDYFRGLTAEVRRPVKRAGLTHYEWDLPAHRRNEPLDCRKTAYAALEGLKEHGLVDLTHKAAPTRKAASSEPSDGRRRVTRVGRFRTVSPENRQR